jgi:hypothetical protein
MRLDVKSMLLGAAAGAATTVVVLVGAGVLFFRTAESPNPVEVRHRTFKLASGATVEVMNLNLSFGDEHSQRGAADDAVGVEYVGPAAAGEPRAKEAAEVFEAVRPIAEALGVSYAVPSAFGSLTRIGGYERFIYERDASGAWSTKGAERMGVPGR